MSLVGIYPGRASLVHLIPKKLHMNNYASYSVPLDVLPALKVVAITYTISSIKQILDEVFVISRIIKVKKGIISQSRTDNPYQDKKVMVLLLH